MMDDPYATRVGPSASDSSSEVRDEQRRRWEAGDRVPAEDLLRDHPSLAGDFQAAVDVIYGEYFLRERMGERPDDTDYLRRFPAYAEVLKDQFALHLAIETLGGSNEPGPSVEGTSRSRRADADLPESFGRYRIIAKIGRGGMGAVYLAHDLQLDRRVALKVPHFDDGLGGRAALRFRREAKIAATFLHPNLCPIFDVGEHGGVVYLTMPLIKGETLAALLSRETAVPEADAARIVSIVALAMVDAHASGVIHRDLKPANIMLDLRGEPIVMDFGLARRELAPEDSATPWGMVLGTPTYMAPEQIGGDPNDLSPASDIYALGVVFYHMLTGRPPYVGSMREIWQQAREGKPGRPSAIRPGISPEIENICLTAMSREPNGRYPSMAAFAEALAASQTPPSSSRNRRRVMLTVAVAMIAFLFVAIAVWPRPRAAPSAALTPGSRWVGTFAFRPPFENYRGDVSLLIKERNGAKFTGIYATEGESYVWECHGDIQGNAISWGFARVIREKTPTNVVGVAHVTGRIEGDAMKSLVFEEPNEGAADMSLIRTHQN